MAHTALINGTNYQVGGGKTLIDGTVYNIMATREVNSTVVVTMQPTSISGQVMTLDNAAFDWTKYKLAGYFITTGTVNGGYRADVYATETKKANKIAYKGPWDTQYLYVEFTITENTTVSGRLTINAVYTGASSQPGWGNQNISLFECTAILKAK